MVFQKRQEIELLKTAALVTAVVNPEKVQKAFEDLQEKMFPFMEANRDRYIQEKMEIMDVIKDWTLRVRA